MPSANPTPWPAETPVLQVGDIRVDLRYRQLQSPSGTTELTSRVFDVLQVFLAEPERLHTREALLQRIWAGVVVEDANLTQTVWVLRRLLGDERKHWIRTVAKRGYVFEPPGPVVALNSVPESVPTVLVPEPVAPPLRPRRQRPAWLVTGLAATVVLVCSLALTWWIQASALQTQPRRVALVILDDPGAAANSRWPATVLHAWLEWQLSLAPEVVVLNAADLAVSEESRSAIDVVMVSVVTSGPGRIRLQARSTHGPAHEAEGALDVVDQLVDDVAHSTLADLLPQRVQEVHPPLQLRGDTAALFAQAINLRQQRDWVPHLERLRSVVEREPEFGLARLQLAQGLTTFGQLRDAQEHLAKLDSWTAQWPGDAKAILAAQRLALSQQHEQAVMAFADLARRFPNQPQFVLDQARAMLRAGLAADVIPLLSAPQWQRQPVAIRILASLNLSAAYNVMGDASHAREAAQSAQQLATSAGWTYERAMAANALAIANWMQEEGPAIAAQFESAAQQYEASGDVMRAHVARFYADLADPQRVPTHLPALLAAARASGHRTVEIDALRRASFKHYRRGEFDLYRQYLDEAAALAESSGALVALTTLDYDRVHEDYLRGNFTSSLARAQRLRAQPALGGLAPSLDVMIGVNSLRQGHLDDGEQALERADPEGALVDKALRRQAPEITFSLACLRGTLALLRGDAPTAQSGFSRCATSTDPAVGLFGRLGQAEIALLGGDTSHARPLLKEVRDQLASVAGTVERWNIAIEWAAQNVRSGDARDALKQLDDLLGPVHASGYAMLELDTRLSLAEAHLALGDIAAAQPHLLAARTLIGADDWLAQRRLSVVTAWQAIEQQRPQQALAVLEPLHQHAVRIHDTAAELQAHELFARLQQKPPCAPERHTSLLTQSGMRGANLSWLQSSARTELVQRTP